ncbi:hypothetical protein HYW20_06955 [Candidatus Woesearchaeota archaeon]|nr:hypothetical protein [Candidatus Woesearchaeota archaeon]
MEFACNLCLFDKFYIRHILELCRKAEETDWRNPQEVDELKSIIDKYAPHSGFESD